MYKIGNKYLCKHKYINVSNERLLNNGDFYEFSEKNHISREIWVQSNSIRLPMSLRQTSLRYVWDYFYTDKELRKLKLEKITKS